MSQESDWQRLMDDNAAACREEIQGYCNGRSWARLEDVYQFARLAAHWANVITGGWECDRSIPSTPLTRMYDHDFSKPPNN
jgi:hypothetical protein